MTDISNTTSDAAEVPQSHESKAKEIGKPGIRAVQGLPEKTSNETVTLNKAAERANLKVKEHVPTLDGKEVEYYKLRGRIGEELAVENIPGSVNINDVTGKSNFANFDVVSPHETSSVKVKSCNAEGRPRVADYNKYFEDISNPGSKANQRAASDLLKMRTEEPEQWQKLAKHLPEDVVNAKDQSKMANALAEISSLRIPGDQVAEVRTKIMQRAMKNSEKYGIDPLIDVQTREQLSQRLVRDRIKPIDKRLDFNMVDTSARALQDQRT